MEIQPIRLNHSDSTNRIEAMHRVPSCYLQCRQTDIYKHTYSRINLNWSQETSASRPFPLSATYVQIDLIALYIKPIPQEIGRGSQVWSEQDKLDLVSGSLQASTTWYRVHFTQDIRWPAHPFSAMLSNGILSHTPCYKLTARLQDCHGSCWTWCVDCRRDCLWTIEQTSKSLLQCM